MTAANRIDPPRDCPACPRLVEYRASCRASEPGWFNAPVPTLWPVGGPAATRLLVVGLAPGVRGANRTGRPFTGDYAGDLLYPTMNRCGFANDAFRADPDDGLALDRAAVTNAVRCVPPQNKPTGLEINTCRPYLEATLSAAPDLAVILALGRIAHDTVLRTLGVRQKDAPFGHGSEYDCAGYTLLSSYHCSRYNTNTGRLTEPMFRTVFERAAVLIAEA